MKSMMDDGSQYLQAHFVTTMAVSNRLTELKGP